MAVDEAEPETTRRSRPVVQLGWRAQVTYSDNANFEPTSTAKGDTFVELTPTLNIHSEGSRLRVDGDFELAGVVYANDTQSPRIFPRGGVIANLEAIERRFFLEAAVVASQEIVNPFGVRPSSGVNFNTQTSVQYRLSPYLQGNIGSEGRYLIRSDNTYTRSYGGDDAQVSEGLGEGYYGRHLAEVVREPRPVGGALRYLRDENRTNVPGATTFAVETLRLSVRAALDSQLTIGLRGGVERNNFTFEEYREGNIVGAELAWRPTPRTTLQGYLEDRFFGQGWDASFTHRMPFLAWDLSSTRDLRSYQQWLFTLPSTGNVAALLNDILTTRFPDPAERRSLVDQLIRSGELPESLTGPFNVLNNGFLLSTRTAGSVAFLGARTGLALTVFKSKDEDLSTLGFAPTSLAQVAPGADTSQQGAGVSAGLRLAPVTTLLVELQRLQTRTLTSAAARPENSVRQDTARIQVSRMLSARASGVLGFRALRSKSDLDAESIVEHAVYVGLASLF